MNVEKNIERLKEARRLILITLKDILPMEEKDNKITEAEMEELVGDHIFDLVTMQREILQMIGNMQTENRIKRELHEKDCSTSVF